MRRYLSLKTFSEVSDYTSHMDMKIFSWIKERTILVLFFQYCGVAILFLGFILANHFFFRWAGIPESINPLYASCDIQSPNIYMLVPIIIFVVFLFILRSILLDLRDYSNLLLIIFFIVFSILLDISIAMIDGGVLAIGRPFTRPEEYFADIGKVKGFLYFLRNYNFIIPTLSIHGQVHPPGPILFLWAGAKLLGESPHKAAFLVIFFSNLAILPIYLLAKNLYGKQTAIYASSLYILTPNIIMFTATSMNAVFAFFSAWSIYLFFKSMDVKNKLFYSTLTGLSLSLGILMSFDLLFIGLFLGIAGIFFLIRKDMKSVLHLSVIPVVVILFYLFLFRIIGFDITGAFLKAYCKYQKDVMEMINLYGSQTVSNNYWFLGNPIAFLLYIGVPTTTLFLRKSYETFREVFKDRKVDGYIISSVITLFIIVCSSLYKGEVERVWLFLALFIIIPAGKELCNLRQAKMPILPFLTFFILFLQVFIFESLLYTYW